MCRYSEHSYKPHYACFNCRKTFKRRLIWDIDRELHSSDSIPIAKCPECAQTMADMGLDFKSPKKSNKKSWEFIQQLYRNDITFHSCGCIGPGYIPRDTNSLVLHLDKILSGYIDQRKFWLKRKEPKTKADRQNELKEHSFTLHNIPGEYITGTRRNKNFETEKAVEYWTDLIEKLEGQITALKESKDLKM